MNSELPLYSKENVRTSVHGINPKRKWVKQQDNHPKHTRCAAKEWLTRNLIKDVEWPGRSPDLNPTEILCEQTMWLNPSGSQSWSCSVEWRISRRAELEKFSVNYCCTTRSESNITRTSDLRLAGFLWNFHCKPQVNWFDFGIDLNGLKVAARSNAWSGLLWKLSFCLAWEYFKHTNL